MSEDMDWIKLVQGRDAGDLKIKNIFSLEAKLVTSSLSISLSWRTQVKKQQGCSPVPYGFPFMHVIIFTKIYLFLEKKNRKETSMYYVTWWHDVISQKGVICIIELY